MRGVVARGKKEMSCSIDHITGSFCLWRQDVLSIQFLSENRRFYDLFVFSVVVTEFEKAEFEDECYIRFDTFDDDRCTVNIMAPMPSERSDTSPHICAPLFESLCSDLDKFALDDDHCFGAAAARSARHEPERSSPTE